MPTAEQATSQWRGELDDLARGVAGGMLFGIPLLFTMEVWWIGTSTDPIRMLLALAITFVPVLLLNRMSGFREGKDDRWGDAVMDTIETLALGLVSVAIMLVLLREITTQTVPSEALGKIVYEATPFSIGIALARSFLSKGRTGDDDSKGSQGGETDATLADVGATLLGSMFVAFNIAPTDEVPMLAAAMPPAWLLAMIAASLGISYLIVFEADFSDQAARHSHVGVIQHPTTETIVAYLLGLVATAAMLTFFQRLDGLPWQVSLSYVIVLGLPAAVGGAAGRLAV